MTKKIEISYERWQQLKGACYHASFEFLQNALNAVRRSRKEKQITKKAGKEMSHSMLAELVYIEIKLTDICEEEGQTFWIDNKGVFKIRLSPGMLNPGEESSSASADQ